MLFANGFETFALIFQNSGYSLSILLGYTAESETSIERRGNIAHQMTLESSVVLPHGSLTSQIVFATTKAQQPLFLYFALGPTCRHYEFHKAR
jgi:hypothetical protein